MAAVHRDAWAGAPRRLILDGREATAVIELVSRHSFFLRVLIRVIAGKEASQISGCQLKMRNIEFAF